MASMVREGCCNYGPRNLRCQCIDSLELEIYGARERRTATATRLERVSSKVLRLSDVPALWRLCAALRQVLFNSCQFCWRIWACIPLPSNSFRGAPLDVLSGGWAVGDVGSGRHYKLPQLGNKPRHIGELDMMPAIDHDQQQTSTHGCFHIRTSLSPLPNIPN